ncbi:MAG: hypothetical protein Q8P67_26830, partial [archaeon]|nr:hypothetical protein [archaeon]
MVPATPPQQIQARCTKCQTLNLFPEASIPRIACYECDTPIDSPLFPKATPALAPRLPQPTPSVSPASQPSLPSLPKPSLNTAPSHSTSNPHITPF